ncbi:MAG: AAA family ATPase [Rhodospirillaceae bacterium]|jgi:ATP-dependent 26S proteasome regulatory subunit|nr:AAA family ATPase [Rhodospirillaceae bacterium]MBT6137311.1 AAA family ATPase [Rhodospirillaceae bacterium]
MARFRDKTEFEEEFALALASRHPVVCIRTSEENRAIDSIQAVADKLDYQELFWSCTRGVFHDREGTLLSERSNKANPAVKGLKAADVTMAIEAFAKKVNDDVGKKKWLLVLLDPDPYIEDKYNNPIHRRRIRDFALQARLEPIDGCIVIVSLRGELPRDLEKEVMILDFPLPSRAEIRSWLDELIKKIGASKWMTVQDGAEDTSEDHEELREAIIDAAVGLTMFEVRYALSQALMRDRILDLEDVREIHLLKQQIIAKCGTLEYLDVTNWRIKDIGGLDVMKEWLRKRRMTFSQASRDFGIPVPKGVLLTGVPGCGKSLAAKCVAASWGMPLIKLDMGRVYGSLVGSSEEHIRHAIAVSEAAAPCVLWIDEIEKGIPRARGSIGDNGVSLRVLATLLTWMQEKDSPVFVFATANDIELLPPEALRRGRFDEIFFVDLPTEAERRKIFEIHLGRAKQDPAQFDLDRLAQLSGPDTYGDEIALSGAEIEAAVANGLIEAFNILLKGNGEPTLTQDQLETAILQTIPIAATRRDDVHSLRGWARGRAVFATEQPHVESEGVRDIIDQLIQS